MKKNKKIEELLDKWEEGNMSVQDLSDELYILFDVSTYQVHDDNWSQNFKIYKMNHYHDFYQRLGFEETGETDYEGNIEHRHKSGISNSNIIRNYSCIKLSFRSSII